MTSARPARSGFDVIVGNPPFLNQLETATTSERKVAAIVGHTSGGVIRNYADLSATFLHASTFLLDSTGCLAMVQPQSLLAAKDAQRVRQAVLDNHALTHLWISNEHVFAGASVFTCAPTLRAGSPRSIDVQTSTRASIDKLPAETIDMDELAIAETWSPLAAAANGIPSIVVNSRHTLGDIATATADFRDQYYGLDGFLVDSAEIPDSRLDEQQFPKIITTGLIDLAESKWGASTTRILKTKWNAPRVDRQAMHDRGDLADWITSRMIPKIMMATQTKVIEAYVDATGEFLPSLPLLTIMPLEASGIWQVAAAVTSPVTTAWAMRTYAGTALSADAIKLSAKQIVKAPLPTNQECWDRASVMLEHAHQAKEPLDRENYLREFAKTSIESYELPEEDSRELLVWWLARAGIPEEHPSAGRFCDSGLGEFMSNWSVTDKDGNPVDIPTGD